MNGPPKSTAVQAKACNGVFKHISGIGAITWSAVLAFFL
jgi:hypothetical protein